MLSLLISNGALSCFCYSASALLHLGRIQLPQRAADWASARWHDPGAEHHRDRVHRNRAQCSTQPLHRASPVHARLDHRRHAGRVQHPESVRQKLSRLPAAAAVSGLRTRSADLSAAASVPGRRVSAPSGRPLSRQRAVALRLRGSLLAGCSAAVSGRPVAGLSRESASICSLRCYSRFFLLALASPDRTTTFCVSYNLV